jgi:hypothetical protein
MYPEYLPRLRYVLCVTLLSSKEVENTQTRPGQHIRAQLDGTDCESQARPMHGEGRRAHRPSCTQRKLESEDIYSTVRTIYEMGDGG